MLRAVSFVPCPPLLVPQIAAGAADETAELRAACAAAVASWSDLDEVLILGTTDHGVDASGFVDSSAVASFGGFGVDVRIPLQRNGSTVGPSLPLPIAIGVWLLDHARIDVSRAGYVCSGATVATDTRQVAEWLSSRPGEVALLVVGDGAARRGERSPGYVDPRGEGYDQEVAAALSSGDPRAVAALNPTVGGELLASGPPAWQVAAGITDGRTWHAQLTYVDAPYGVGYAVATWA